MHNIIPPTFFHHGCISIARSGPINYYHPRKDLYIAYATEVNDDHVRLANLMPENFIVVVDKEANVEYDVAYEELGVFILPTDSLGTYLQ